MNFFFDKFLTKFIVVKFFVLIICIDGTFSEAVALNVAGYEMTENEVSALPDYLKIRLYYHLRSNESPYKNWEKRLGPDYIHVHHFAFGIIFAKRAILNKDKKHHYLNRAISEYSYVIRNSRNKLPILHHVYAKRADAYVELGNCNFAIIDYQASVNLNSGYVYAYTGLAGCYSSLGMTDEAAAVLKMMNSATGSHFEK